MKCLIALLFLAIQPVFSGFERVSFGAANSGLGSASFPVLKDVWAVRANPAGLTCIEGLTFGADVEPDPFGIVELRTFSAALAVPSVFGNFGVAAETFGFALYRELSLSLAYGGRIAGFGLGVRANVHSVTIERYGHAASLSCDAGVLIPLPPWAAIGFSFNNIGGSTIGASRERLPQTFFLGASLSPLSELTLFGAYGKEPGFDASARFGVAFAFLGHGEFRAGIDGEPSMVCAGFGFSWGMVRLDYALTHHDDLAWTQEMSLTFTWGGAHE